MRSTGGVFGGREVNERVAETAVAQGIDEHEFEFLCECSNLDCTRRVPLGLAAYEAIRRDPDVFIVRPGRELPEIEHHAAAAATAAQVAITAAGRVGPSFDVETERRI